MRELDDTFGDLSVRPGWRIMVLHQEETQSLEVIFTYNHSHADGISGKVFYGNLFERLNGPGPSATNQELDGTIRFTMKPNINLSEIPPPIEDVCKFPITLGYTMKMAWEELEPSSISFRRPSLTRWSPIQSSPYKTQLYSFDIDHDDSSRIVACCRRRKTTITGLLHALLLFSLSSQLDAPTAVAFESATTMQLRRFMPSSSPKFSNLDPDRTMGKYVTLMP